MRTRNKDYGGLTRPNLLRTQYLSSSQNQQSSDSLVPSEHLLDQPGPTMEVEMKRLTNGFQDVIKAGNEIQVRLDVVEITQDNIRNNISQQAVVNVFLRDAITRVFNELPTFVDLRVQEGCEATNQKIRTIIESQLTTFDGNVSQKLEKQGEAITDLEKDFMELNNKFEISAAKKSELENLNNLLKERDQTLREVKVELAETTRKLARYPSIDQLNQAIMKMETKIMSALTGKLKDTEMKIDVKIHDHSDKARGIMDIKKVDHETLEAEMETVTDKIQMIRMENQKAIETLIVPLEESFRKMDTEIQELTSRTIGPLGNMKTPREDDKAMEKLKGLRFDLNGTEVELKTLKMQHKEMAKDLEMLRTVRLPAARELDERLAQLEASTKCAATLTGWDDRSLHDILDEMKKVQDEVRVNRISTEEIAKTFVAHFDNPVEIASSLSNSRLDGEIQSLKKAIDDLQNRASAFGPSERPAPPPLPATDKDVGQRIKSEWDRPLKKKASTDPIKTQTSILYVPKEADKIGRFCRFHMGCWYRNFPEGHPDRCLLRHADTHTVEHLKKIESKVPCKQGTRCSFRSCHYFHPSPKNDRTERGGYRDTKTTNKNRRPNGNPIPKKNTTAGHRGKPGETTALESKIIRLEQEIIRLKKGNLPTTTDPLSKEKFISKDALLEALQKC